MFSEEEGESLEWDLPPEDDSADDDGDLPNDNLGDRDEVGERNSGNSGNTTDEYDVPADLGDDAWLAAIQYTPGKKSVCFQFAKEGRCEFMEKTGKCIYSHDAEDIKKYKKLRRLLARKPFKRLQRGCVNRARTTKLIVSCRPRPLRKARVPY